MLEFLEFDPGIRVRKRMRHPLVRHLASPVFGLGKHPIAHLELFNWHQAFLGVNERALCKAIRSGLECKPRFGQCGDLLREYRVRSQYWSLRSIFKVYPHQRRCRVSEEADPRKLTESSTWHPKRTVLGQVSHFPFRIYTSHIHPPFSNSLITRLTVELETSNASAMAVCVCPP